MGLLPHEVIRPLLPPAWTLRAAAHLTTRKLERVWSGRDTRPYQVVTMDDGHVVRVELRSADGELAACGLHGRECVFGQIATADGRALYRTLGWAEASEPRFSHKGTKTQRGTFCLLFVSSCLRVGLPSPDLHTGSWEIG